MSKKEPIVSVNINSGDVTFYGNVREAIASGFSGSSIYGCLTGGAKKGMGHCWFYKTEQDERVYQEKALLLIGTFNTNFSKPINMIEVKSGQITVLNNIYEVEQLGFKVKEVSRILRSEHKSVKGFRFELADSSKPLNPYKKVVYQIDPTILEKKCPHCAIKKPITEFNRAKHHRDGHSSVCRPCEVIKNRKAYLANPEKIKAQTLEYYHSNKDELRPKRLAYQKKMVKEDPFFKVCRNLRNRLYHGLKNKNWKKDTHFTEYIGCERDFLIQHIEKQFLPGMTWENYSQTTWHIDHHIPLDSASTVEDLYKLCHYSNLKPMWAKDNIRKGNKVG